MESVKNAQIINKIICKREKEKMMKKFVCTVCGYEYDPAEHDNVAFEDLPDDYTCPLCGVGKDQFEEE